jgi:Raf kinase inhibitor-like YbhB/YbcL family protein
MDAFSGVLAAMILASPSFAPDGPIPPRFTCDGANVSPALAWKDVPVGTRALALVVSDPDAPDPAAPKTIWTHWVLYNLPAEAHGLREAISPKGLPADTLEGRNDWGRTGYGGPCPPIGRHRYVHTLYALDVRLPDLAGPTRASLLSAIAGHVLAEATLVGTYQRQ